eukprot:CAMPEP_0194165184 /NCGR_PEP_ID=MMETSP0154-20130528/1184_1 /TAXON_ID=1049557 /ORGANISM="Thalassiothrix antarctica, Strain L6-D1" /LENGTH=384 /DNA_ID=CAMNT_0038875561 /DNA_START=32 /DNA_END=1183 /DNA_ORIENTATION=-
MTMMKGSIRIQFIFLRMISLYSLLILLSSSSLCYGFLNPQTTTSINYHHSLSSKLFYSTGEPSELPDSLEDGAEVAAESCVKFYEEFTGGVGSARCRVEFNTLAGDETFTLLKQSTNFMQPMVSFLCNAMIPGLQERRMEEMMRVSQARAQLRALGQPDPDNPDTEEEKSRRVELMTTLQNDGRIVDASDDNNNGPIARVYFPDEGNAALARRDWAGKVPDCVRFASCGGMATSLDVSNDVLVFFFCPKASEAAYVEEILLATEEKSQSLKLTVFVNPNLVDMGVTGFGMAGRRLRERLLQPLQYTYYLRTLQWGALTRTWPQAYSIWQEDAEAEGGYRLIKALPNLPSNPEVEDYYDIENGLADARPEGGGFLDQLGDFVNGM